VRHGIKMHISVVITKNTEVYSLPAFVYPFVKTSVNSVI